MIKKFSLLLLIVTSVVSCKKNDNPYTELPEYSGPVMVNFNNYISNDGYWGYAKKDIDLVNAWVDFEFEVKLSNTVNPATETIKVKLLKTDVNVYEYNNNTGNILSPVPLSAIKFEQTEVIIPKGSRTAKFKFQVNPSLLNLSLPPAVGISIAEVLNGNAVVNSDNKQTRLVVELSALNKYDGIYNKTSFFSHPVLTNLGGVYGVATPFEVEMITSGPNSVDSYVTAFYNYPTEVVVDWGALSFTYFTGVNPRFTINATTNAVTVSTAPIPAITGQAVIEQNTADKGASKYYPTGIPGYSAGKPTIVGHFRWSVPTDRVARDTFVYVKPR